jgi:hypothetical protein
MDYFAISFGFPTFIFIISYLIFEIVTYMLSAFLVLNKLVSLFKKKTTKISLKKIQLYFKLNMAKFLKKINHICII